MWFQDRGSCSISYCPRTPSYGVCGVVFWVLSMAGVVEGTDATDAPLCSLYVERSRGGIPSLCPVHGETLLQ